MLARKLMLSLVADFQQNKPLVLNPQFLQGIKSILTDSSLDKVLTHLVSCRCLCFMSEEKCFANYCRILSGIHC